MNIPLIIVVLYIILLFGISFYVSGKQKKDGAAFLLYKGRNNMFVVASSIAGLAIGGASTIGIAENAFSVGLSAGWYDTAWAIGAVLTAFLAVKYLRKSGYNTISKLVDDLYGKSTSFIMVIAMVIIQCGIIALQYKAGGSILASLLPDIFTVETGTFFSFVIFMLVAMIGGMGSVSLTNVLNLVLIYVGVIVAAFLVLNGHGGWEAIDSLVVSQPDVPYMSLTAGMGWIGIFSWIVVMIGNTNSVQGVVQIGLTWCGSYGSCRLYMRSFRRCVKGSSSRLNRCGCPSYDTYVTSSCSRRTYSQRSLGGRYGYRMLNDYRSFNNSEL